MATQGYSFYYFLLVYFIGEFEIVAKIYFTVKTIKNDVIVLQSAEDGD